MKTKFKGYHRIYTDEFGKYKKISFDETCESYSHMTENDILWAQRAWHVIITDTTFRGNKYGPRPNVTISTKLY